MNDPILPEFLKNCSNFGMCELVKPNVGNLMPQIQKLSRKISSQCCGTNLRCVESQMWHTMTRIISSCPGHEFLKVLVWNQVTFLTSGHDCVRLMLSNTDMVNYVSCL
jgi:hypothetical protein